MHGDIRARALAFLVERHWLTPAEAGQALTVAAGVLRSGLNRLTAAAQANDGQGCAEAAHALKGNLLNLGLSDLAATTHQACDQTRKGDTSAALAAAHALARTLAPLLDVRPD